MRRELAELRHFHGEPLHNTARQSIDAASRQIRQAMEKLGGVKNRIVQGAKAAAVTIKEKGIGALNSAVSFLGVRDDLENIRRDSMEGVGKCEQSLAKVENISRRYHEVGTATRNFGRALTGKEIRDDTKESGKLAKLASAPFSVMKSLHAGMVKGAEAVLGKLEKLEQAAKKPSMLGNLQTMKETAAKEHGMALSPEKPTKEPSL